MKTTFGQRLEWFLAVNVIFPLVPKHDRATAVLPFRNNSLKCRVIDRVIFDLHREMLFALLPRQTLGHGPRLQHAIHFQPKIVMQSTRIMLLNDETVGALNTFRQWLACGLGSFSKVAFSFVLS